MASTATVRANKRVARRYPEDVATAGNIDAIDEICTADVVDHTPWGDVEGREALKEEMRRMRSALEDFSATVEDVVAEGDTVAMRVTLRGTHVGEFMGIGPTDEPFEIWNTVFTRIENGRIAERWVHPDMLGMLDQLGAVESPLG